jgi:O-antigen ligase
MPLSKILRINFYFILLASIGGQLLRFSIFGINLVLIDIFSLFFLFFCILFFLQKQFDLFKYKFFIPLLLFFIILIISLLNSIYFYNFSLTQIIKSSLYIIRIISYFSLLLVLPQIFDKNILKKILFFSVFIIFLLGLLQIYFFPSFYDLNMHLKGWDPHINRLLSTWFDPNFLGALFALTGIISISDYKTNQKKISLFIFSVSLFGLFLTFSRGSYLAFFSSFFLYALIYLRKYLILSLILLFLAYNFNPRFNLRINNALNSAYSLVVKTEKTLDPTSYLRLKSWEVGINLFKKHPFLGVGYNNLPYLQKTEWTFLTDSHASSGIDSSLLTVLASSGIFGLFFYLWIFFGIIKNLIQKTNPFKIGIIFGIFCLFIHSIFVNTLFFNLILPFFFGFISLGLNNKKSYYY